MLGALLYVAVSTTSPTTANALGASQAPVVVIWEDWSSTIDVHPPQRLDVRMSPDGDIVARCEGMAGELIGYPEPDPDALDITTFVCEGVDY